MESKLSVLVKERNSSVFILFGIFVFLLFKAGVWFATGKEKYAHHGTRIEHLAQSTHESFIALSNQGDANNARLERIEQLAQSTHDTVVALGTKVNLSYECTNL